MYSLINFSWKLIKLELLCLNFFCSKKQAHFSSYFVWKQAHFSLLSSKAIKLWLKKKKMVEIENKLGILQPFQNCDLKNGSK